jgi:hypothetical protein
LSPEMSRKIHTRKCGAGKEKALGAMSLPLVVIWWGSTFPVPCQ